jgi:hypothetical protein
MVPIPEGSESHSEESGYVDYGESQEMLDQPLDQPGELAGSGGTYPEDYNPRAPVSGGCELSG